ncbi:MAG: SUMF1/EgtB/PvdO family nonheme iron enzyme [Candidatus Contendobacter sp.]|nr:SUMF1/EgtB/PvdO family nonheme iron enzyme [Candidatus Contendobacter sp.]
MELEKRLGEATKADAAGLLNKAGLAQRQQKGLHSATTGEDPSLLADGDTPESGSGALDAGMVLGPPERRVRLLHDLSGKQRIWLVRIASSGTRDDDTADDFRAIKIFLPVDHVTREAGRDERALRADSLGLRAYLTKARARVAVATKLEHPSIARVYGWRYGADGWPFAEMEYIDHPMHSLAQLLRQQPSGLSWDTVLKWLRPVADALDYARLEQRLAHQHLDVDTVFITDQGAVKVLGFGLATEIREPRSILFSASGSAGGTVAEGSGESGSAETVFRRDVFALALLIYELLAGRSAYAAQGQTLGAIPRSPGLTDDAWRVLRRGLAYPSELCPIDAGRFLNELEAAQQPSLGVRRSRRSLLERHGALAAGLSLVVMVGGYWLATRTSESPGANLPALTEADGTAQSSAGERDPRTVANSLALAQQAEHEADLRAFEAAKRVDAVAAYRLYVQRCPRCDHGQEAHAAIRRLENQEKVSLLQAEFATLAQTVEREGHEDRGDAALARLKALAELTPDDPFIATGRRRIALVWVARGQTGLKQPNLAEARKWLKKAQSVQVDLPELATLAQALAQAEVAERNRQTDADGFAAARNANTRRAYWAYLDRCAASCGYRAEAEAALIRLAPTNPVMRDRLNDSSQGPEMVAIPAGAFLMGSPPQEKGRYADNEFLHPVQIDKAFAIGKYEVMFHEYDRFATATGRTLPDDKRWGRSRLPVINVSWQDAMAYAEWLSQQTGARYRLPTEVEWEYAARARTTTSRYWGDDPDQGCAYANAADLDGKQLFVGWTEMKCHDGHIYTAPTGSYRSNDFGLHDMAGNVLEWTCSLYDKDSRVAPVQSCEAMTGEREFVVRGGSWNDEPRNVRSADRHRSPPDFRDYYLGFRLVRELP